MEERGDTIIRGSKPSSAAEAVTEEGFGKGQENEDAS